MKNLFTLLTLGCLGVFSGYSQEIIPFPDLSGNHSAASSQADLIDDRNYSLFTEDYRTALKSIDQQIDQLDVSIQNASNSNLRTTLTDKKRKLLHERSELLDEAEILEDLNKFY